MKDYFKRLKHHPGLRFAAMFTGMGFLAGALNSTYGDWWQGGLIGMAIMFCFTFGIVLVSNLFK